MNKITAHPADPDERAPTLSDVLAQLDNERRAVVELRREVHELGSQLATFRSQLSSEVRTRRLVVVDDEGQELVYTNTYNSWVEFVVEWPGEDPDNATVKLSAAADDGLYGAVAVWIGGNPAADLIARLGDSEDTLGRRRVTTDLTLVESYYERSGANQPTHVLELGPVAGVLSAGRNRLDRPAHCVFELDSQRWQ